MCLYSGVRLGGDVVVSGFSDTTGVLHWVTFFRRKRPSSDTLPRGLRGKGSVLYCHKTRSRELLW